MTFKTIALALTAVAALSTGSAGASTIQVEAIGASTPFLGSAIAYRDAVDAALAAPGAETAMASTYDGLTHGQFFSNTGTWAMKSTIEFGVATASTFDFRVGVDFGMGGAMFLDGQAVDFRGNDMWWGFDFNNAAGVFSATAALAAGNHTLSVYGFEGCCDGGQNAQFRAAGQQWTTFSNADGLNKIDTAADVPEPATLGIMLTGVALLAASRRRKAAQNA